MAGNDINLTSDTYLQFISSTMIVQMSNAVDSGAAGPVLHISESNQRYVAAAARQLITFMTGVAGGILPDTTGLSSGFQTLKVAGGALVTGSLAVSGSFTARNNAYVSGAFTTAGNLFATGSTAVSGALSVVSTTTLSGTVTMNGNLTFNSPSAQISLGSTTDAGNAHVRYDKANANNQTTLQWNMGGTLQWLLQHDTSENLNVLDNGTNLVLRFERSTSNIVSRGIRGLTDATHDLGTSSVRWLNIYGVTGSFVTASFVTASIGKLTSTSASFSQIVVAGTGSFDVFNIGKNVTATTAPFGTGSFNKLGVGADFMNDSPLVTSDDLVVGNLESGGGSGEQRGISILAPAFGRLTFGTAFNGTDEGGFIYDGENGGLTLRTGDTNVLQLFAGTLRPEPNAPNFIDLGTTAQRFGQLYVTGVNATTGSFIGIVSASQVVARIKEVHGFTYDAATITSNFVPWYTTTEAVSLTATTAPGVSRIMPFTGQMLHVDLRPETNGGATTCSLYRNYSSSSAIATGVGTLTSGSTTRFTISGNYSASDHIHLLISSTTAVNAIVGSAVFLNQVT